MHRKSTSTHPELLAQDFSYTSDGAAVRAISGTRSKILLTRIGVGMRVLTTLELCGLESETLEFKPRTER